MECNVPTDIAFSFTGLRCRGGKTAHHGDGWGLALYEGSAARVFLEPTAAAQSPLARFVSDNPIKTMLAIGHIRKKTRGAVSLANTHPFVRELWGRHWVFAHNGTVKRARALKLGRYEPIGNTDSEHAYCYMLEALRSTFAEYPRDARDLWAAIADAAGRIGGQGSFNFLMGDGRHLYARCATKLCYLVRKAPFGCAQLSDEDVTIDFSAVTTPKDRVAIVSTVPLTANERWTHGEPGTMWVFDRGDLRATLPS
jgi:glutamine amidotransferase